MTKNILVPPVVRAELWDSYCQAKPKTNATYEAWVDEEAQKHELPKQAIRRVIATETAIFQEDFREARKSAAQNAANALGLTLAEAILVHRKCLRAKKRHYFRDRNGPIKDPLTGRYQYDLVDDMPIQHAAVRTAYSLHGAFAPQEFKVEQEVGPNLAQLTKEEIEAQLAATGARILELMGGDAKLPGFTTLDAKFERAGQQAARGDASAGARADRSKGKRGRVLLANQSDEDQGRTGDALRG